MRVLFLTPKFPFPLDAGTSMRNFRLLQSAAMEHEVDLLSFVDEPVSDESMGIVQGVCRQVSIIPRPIRSKGARLARLLTTSVPDLVARLDSKPFAQAARATTEREPYDVVEAEGLEMASYLRLCSARRRVLSEHNVEHLLQRRAMRVDRARVARWPAAAYSAIQASRLASFEAAACRSSDAVLTVSDEDADDLRALEPRGRYVVLPNAVDTSAEMAPRGDPAAPVLLFTGTLDFRPNVDAAEWLAGSVLPRVWEWAPAARAYIVGKAPQPALVARGQRDSRVVVTGAVPSIDPYWARATVYVLPMRLGGGVRFKALEAMVAGIPIVSTAMGMYGIDASPGIHFLQGETTSEIALGIRQLSGDQALRSRVISEARSLVERHYDWRNAAPILLDLYSDIA